MEKLGFKFNIKPDKQMDLALLEEYIKKTVQEKHISPYLVVKELFPNLDMTVSFEDFRLLFKDDDDEPNVRSVVETNTSIVNVKEVKEENEEIEEISEEEALREV